MQCVFIKLSGNQCEANAIKGSHLCFTHNPDMEEARKLAIKRGGQAYKKNKNPLSIININDTEGVVILLTTTINEVRAGTIELRVANCIGYLAGHLIKAYEITNLEKRIIDIEKTLK